MKIQLGTMRDQSLVDSAIVKEDLVVTDLNGKILLNFQEPAQDKRFLPTPNRFALQKSSAVLNT